MTHGLEKLVIGVVGMPGSGKSTALSVLKEKHGGHVFTMGDMVREELLSRGKENTPENLGALAKELRRERGDTAVAELTIEKITREWQGNGIIIIDGIRSIVEVDLFRDHWNLVLLAVHSPPDTRHRRMLARARADDATELKDFETRDKRELSFGIGGAIAMADEMVINDDATTKEELQDRVTMTVQKYMGGGA